MRARVLLVLGALVALAALVAVRGAGRGVADGASPASTPAPLPTAGVAPSTVPIDPTAVRDIFRYGNEPAVARRSPHGPSLSARVDAAVPARARLVGLVRRTDRLLAAIAIDGDVLVLGQGESVSGYTVLAVGEEGVRLRGPDGREETLPLP